MIFPAANNVLRSKGFTLLELMIAIGLMALVAAVSMPAIHRGLQKEGMRKAVEDMMEGCSYARAMAILHGIPTEFVLRAADGQISVRSVQVENSDFGDEQSATPKTFPFSRRMPESVAVNFLYVNFKDQMEQPEIRVRFYPNGTSDEFTAILFSIEGERKISLDVVTGLAEMEVLR
jgi:prepilin-type N-terminal cleavage/methylation domain-containing protein